VTFFALLQLTLLELSVNMHNLGYCRITYLEYPNGIPRLTRLSPRQEIVKEDKAFPTVAMGTINMDIYKYDVQHSESRKYKEDKM
jgi:hypothetical protein